LRRAGRAVAALGMTMVVRLARELKQVLEVQEQALMLTAAAV